jgi:biotin carboxyl carrier protein
MLPRYVYRHWEVFFWLVATLIAGVLSLLIAGAMSGANPIGPGDDPIPQRVFIVSPCYGVLCAGPSPGSAPFVTIGRKVTPDTIVCKIQDRQIVPVRAGVFGTVVDILVVDDQMVFPGQRLFEVQLDPIAE